MSNLLDKASIILTPTAYNNGEALCVKPSDGSGDFDFSRNSAATRVNAQGLVENVQILSSNLVQNGDFSEEGVQEVSNGSFSQEGSELVTNGDFATDSDWSKDAGWTISNGTASCNGSGVNSLQQSGITTVGKVYKLTFDVLDSNDFDFLIISTNFGDTYVDADLNSAVVLGRNTFYIKPTNGTGIRFRVANGTTLSIDNVSVREVGQDWEIASGSGWSIGDSKLIGVNALNYSAYQSPLISGKTYKITYEVKDYVSGTFGIRANTASGITVTANGIYTDYIKSNGNTLYLMGFGTFNGSVTNISVKEVGQNWTLGTGWEIGNSVATKSGTDLSYLTQSSLTSVVGKTYNVKASITNVTTGNVRIDNFTSGTTYTSDTEVDVIYTATTAGAFRFLGWSGFDGTITNISVLEITDDTNLPRINYEGFSYQDVLGSEEVLNGGFDDGGANWTVIGVSPTFINSTAVFQNDAKIYQANAAAAGKKNKVVINFNEISGNGIRVYYGGGFQKVYSVQDIIDNDLKIEETIEFVGGETLYIYSLTSSTYAVIDNVSVKEYLGQEVVSDSGCGSWLFEPQSTNLVTYSEDFSHSYWQKSNSNVTPNSTISPDGTTNATLMVGTVQSATGSYIRATTTAATTIGETYTLSLYVKPKGDSKFFKFWARNTDASFIIFNLVDGTTDSPTTSTITNVGSGWFRVTTTGVLTTATVAPYFYTYYSATESEGFYIWAAQIEQGNISSYIPTSGSTVTRNQDVCNNGGSLATINSTEGVLYAEIAALTKDSSYKLISLKAIDFNNRIEIGIGTNNKIHVYLVSNSATLIGFTSQDFTIDEVFKVALKWSNTNGCTLYINGSQITTAGNSTFSALDFNALDFNNFYGNPFFGKTKALAVWKEALSDQELTELTTI